MPLKTIIFIFLYGLILNGLMAQSQQDSVLKRVDSLLQQLKKVDSDAQKINIYHELLRPKNKVKNNRKKIIQGALDLAKRNDNPALAAMAYLRASLDLINQGEYKQANEYLGNAYQYYSKQTLNKELVTTMILQGYYFHRQNYSTEALKTYLKALPLAKELKDLKRTNNLYNRIVNIYLFQEKYDKALYYTHQIEKNCNELAPSKCPFYYTSLQTRGSVYLFLNELDSARSVIKITNDRFKEPINRKGVCANLALLNQKEGNFEQALIYADSSLQLAILTKQPLAVANMHFLNANICDTLGQTEQAVYHLQQQIHVANRHQFAKQKMQALDKLSHIYQRQNDYKTAYHYGQDWRIMKDSIATVDQANLTKRYDELLEEYEKEEQLQSLQQIQLAQQNQRNILLAVSLFLILFLGMAAFFIYTRNRLNSALQEKNKLLNKAVEEREMLIKEVHHRVKNNLQIITSLLNLQMRHLRHPEAKVALKDSQNRIKSMTLIHQHLYQEITFKGISSRIYLEHLLRNIQDSFILKEVEIKQQIDDLSIGQESMVLIGLVVNEAITNIFKHAFPDTSEGLIHFSFKKENQHVIVCIEDNGIGLPEGINVASHHSFGLQLIQDIATKLKAKYQFTNQTQGTILQMKISLERM